MPMPSKGVVLVDETSPANTAYNITVDTSDYDEISLDFISAGGSAAGGGPSLFVRPAGAASAVGEYQRAGNGNLSAAWTLANMGWGPGCTTGFGGITGFGAPLPPAIRINIPAQGVGVTVRTIVYGRRQFRGPPASLTKD